MNLVRPPRLAGESSIGFSLRTAWVNGLCNPAWLSATLPAPSRELRQAQLRCCPSCILDLQGFWHEDWLHNPWPICLSHKSWLLDRCMQCQSILTSGTARFNRCSCGAEYGLQDGVANPVLWAASERTLPPPVAIWLGAFCRQDYPSRPGKLACARDIRSIHPTLEEGCAIWLEWPRRFKEHLSARADSLLTALASNEVQHDRSLPLHQVFPGLTRRLKVLPEEWRQRVTAALGEWLNHRATAGRALWTRSPTLPHTPSHTQVAKSMGMRGARLSRLLKDSGVVHSRHVMASGRERTSVSPISLQQLQAVSTSRRSTSAASKEVGLSTFRIQALVDAGMLHRSFDSGVDGNSIRDLIQSLRAVSVQGSPDDPISLSTALRLKVPRFLTKEFFEALLQSHEALALYAPPISSAMSGLSLSAAQVQEWVNSQRRGVLLSIAQTAEAMDLKQQVVYDLARTGLLAVVPLRIRGRIARMVSREAIRQFQTQYVPLARLARSEGVRTRDAYAWASQRGLSVVTGPLVDGSRQYFVRTQDIAIPVAPSRGAALSHAAEET